MRIKRRAQTSGIRFDLLINLLDAASTVLHHRGNLDVRDSLSEDALNDLQDAVNAFREANCDQ